MVCVQKRNLLRLDRISRCGAKKEESTIIVPRSFVGVSRVSLVFMFIQVQISSMLCTHK